MDNQPIEVQEQAPESANYSLIGVLTVLGAASLGVPIYIAAVCGSWGLAGQAIKFALSSF